MSFNTIAINGLAYIFLCDRQTKARVWQVVGYSKHGKFRTNGLAGIPEYTLKICRAENPKPTTEACAVHPDASGNAENGDNHSGAEYSAAFGATRIEDFTATFSGHAGTEAVITLTL